MSIYEQVRRANTNSEFRRVRIVEVNPANRYVLARDFYDRDYQISFDFHGSVIHIPAKDEIWLIKSYQTEWRLDRKLEGNTIEELAQGDKALKADGKLYLDGTQVLINGRDSSELITAEDVPAIPPIVTEVAKDGTLVGTRKRINLITGANTTLTIADNAAQDRVDITVAATSQNPWTDSGWQRLGIEIPYEGGHSNYGNPFGGVGYVGIRRLASGLVIGRGLISNSGAGGPVFTVPAGFRPSSLPEVWIIHTANSGSGTESFRMATVTGAGGEGNAWAMRNSSGWGWCSLSGICWYAEQ